MGRTCSFGATFVCLLVIGGPVASASDNLTKHHALSLISAPKHGPDFTHFDWVNPNAPKGGAGPALGHGAPSTRSTRSRSRAVRPPGWPDLRYADDAKSRRGRDLYGLLAEWVTYPDDFSSATFQLRKGARFHDGKPITPEDVIFSLDVLKKVSPNHAFYYKDVVKAEKTGDSQVTFTSRVKGNRELPMIIGELPVLPKHYWEGIGANGEPRDLSKSTLEMPLGSGPYRIKEVDAGRTHRLRARQGLVGEGSAGLQGPVELRRDQVRLFPRPRAGVPGLQGRRSSTSGARTSAKYWATGYDFDAVKRGLVKLDQLPVEDRRPDAVVCLQLRRPQFQDARVRQAFNLAFDFEWANKNLFYDLTCASAATSTTPS